MIISAQSSISAALLWCGAVDIQSLLLMLYCVFTVGLGKDFLFTKFTSSSAAAVMEYACDLQPQYNIYKNDIINHYGEGNGSAALQTPLSCEQPFLLSLNSIVCPPCVLLFITCLIYCAALSVHIGLCKWSFCNKGYWNKSAGSSRISDAGES